VDTESAVFQIVEERRAFEPDDDERFDRMQFAARALALLKPAKLTVVLYPKRRTLTIERGRDLRRSDGGGLAIVGIPRRASRRHIALALAEISGVAEVPYVVDVLVRAASDLSQPPR
jgi:hypothetical protein